jgi:hypothetical protein
VKPGSADNGTERIASCTGPSRPLPDWPWLSAMARGLPRLKANGFGPSFLSPLGVVARATLHHGLAPNFGFQPLHFSPACFVGNFSNSESASAPDDALLEDYFDVESAVQPIVNFDTLNHILHDILPGATSEHALIEEKYKSPQTGACPRNVILDCTASRTQVGQRFNT